MQLKWATSRMVGPRLMQSLFYHGRDLGLGRLAAAVWSVHAVKVGYKQNGWAFRDADNFGLFGKRLTDCAQMW